MKYGAVPLLAGLLATGTLGCDVPNPAPPRGANIPDPAPRVDGGPTCDRGVVVVEQPEGYGSTNVVLVAEDGAVLSTSIATSSTSSVGLTPPLTGDVVPPTQKALGHEIVLVDRKAGASRIVWVDVATAARRELSVAPGGFYANPYDYVAVSPTKAYVARYGSNPEPDKAPFDHGNDLVVLDPTVPKIVSAIDLVPALGSDAARALPRPGRIVTSSDRAFVLLDALARDFSVTVPSRMATIDVRTDRVTDVLVLDGFENCLGLALSPSSEEVSVLCSGNIDPNAPSSLSGSGVLSIDVRGAPRVSKTFTARDLGAGSVGFYGDYAAEGVLLAQTFGYLSDQPTPAADDTVLRLDLTAGTSEVLLRSAGTAFTLGGIVCDAACGTCFVADAGRAGGVLHRFDVDPGGRLLEGPLVKVETDPGYPPRTLGRF